MLIVKLSRNNQLVVLVLCVQAKANPYTMLTSGNKPGYKKDRPVLFFLTILFIVLLPLITYGQPQINGFTPTTGSIGSSVIISGTGFSTTPSQNIVFFGSVMANVTAATSGSLTVTVPAGLSNEAISVTVNRLTGYSAVPFIPTFSGGISFTNNNTAMPNTAFQLVTEITTDDHPNDIVMRDFDGDGYTDIATANNFSITGSPASISIIRNTTSAGNLSMATPQSISTGVLTYAINSADFDGDGKPDIVSSSVVDKTISVFKNTSSPGTISFAPKKDYETGNNPHSISVADINRDGKPDIVIANLLSNTIIIYRNTSTSTELSFVLQNTLTTALGPNFVSARDIDGDNLADLIVSNQYSASVSVFRNTSTGGIISFATRQDFTTDSEPSGVSIGDMDGDGKPDLVVSNRQSTGFCVLRNNGTAGNISFATRLCNNFTDDRYAVSLADLNGDGKLDVALAGENLRLYQNTSVSGVPSFGGMTMLRPSTPSFRLGIADLDNDGKLDIVNPGFSTDRVVIYRNRGNEPTISYFSPMEAGQGETVTITGVNFTGATGVSFGGVNANSFSVTDPTTIKAVVGNGASGLVRVTTPKGTQSLTGFTYKYPPVITSISPENAGSGMVVTITGNYLANVTGVSFGGVPAAAIQGVSGTTVRATVGAGATGAVFLSTVYGSTTFPGFTYFPTPTIQSFTPTIGGPGTIVVISGTGFLSVGSVKIGGVPVASFVVNSSTQITATVGTGKAGSIEVITPGGTAISENGFLFPVPVINSFSPVSAEADSLIIIQGNNFSEVPADNIVYFGSVKAEVINAAISQLTVRVPKGAIHAPITVTLNNYTAYSSEKFSLKFSNNGETLNGKTFEWQKAFVCGTNFYRINLVDFDGDGRADVLNTSNHGLVALRNTTTEKGFYSFDNQQYPVSSYNGAEPRVVVADMNGDGKQDVVVSNFSSQVAVSINTSTIGQISFAPKISYPFSSPWGLTVGDFDGDGRMDIVISAWNLSTVSPEILFMKNMAQGNDISFAVTKSFPTDFLMNNFKATDIDGDGKTDLIVTKDSYKDFHIYRNVSTGPGDFSFAPEYYIKTNSNAYEYMLTDMDEDGKLDILTSTEGKLKLHPNLSTIGGISFGSVKEFRYDTESPGKIITGDLNGDGKPDILLTDEDSVFVIQNNSTSGNFSFGNAFAYKTRVAYNWAGYSAIGDIDGDGKPELCVVNDAVSSVSVFRNLMGERIDSVCNGVTASIAAGKTGSVYQWQINTGNGFTEISDGNGFSGSRTSNLQLANASLALNGAKLQCLVDGVPALFHHLVVLPIVKPSSTITAPDKICVNQLFNITLAQSPSTPYGSILQVWKSVNNAPFTYFFSDTYYANGRIPLEISSPGLVKFFVRIIPHAGIPCPEPNNTDTVQVNVMGIPDLPTITSNGSAISVTNPVAGLTYYWESRASNGTWVDFFPQVSGTSYPIRASGTYRVRISDHPCGVYYSNPLSVVFTSIQSVPGSTMGLHISPNPVRDIFRIDTLRFADKWELLDVIGIDQRPIISNMNIKGKTSVQLNATSWAPGRYFVILKRKEKEWVVLSVIKI